jgi:hypothetical protein
MQISSETEEIHRCTARPESLDAPGARRRTQAITDFLISVWDPDILWNDFGVRADVLVSSNFLKC